MTLTPDYSSSSNFTTDHREEGGPANTTPWSTTKYCHTDTDTDNFPLTLSCQLGDENILVEHSHQINGQYYEGIIIIWGLKTKPWFVQDHWSVSGLQSKQSWSHLQSSCLKVGVRDDNDINFSCYTNYGYYGNNRSFFCNWYTQLI